MPSSPFAIAVEPPADPGPRFRPRTLAVDDLPEALAFPPPLDAWPARPSDEDPERWDGLA